MSTEIDLDAAHRQALEANQKRVDKAAPGREFAVNLQAATHLTNAKLREDATAAGINVAGHSVIESAVRATARAPGPTQQTPVKMATEQQAARTLITQTAPSVAGVVSGTSTVKGVVGNTLASAVSASNGLTAEGSAGSSNANSSQNESAQLLQATGQLQELNQQFNLQYLQLQENEQAQSRQFTSISNVSKLRNDTAKNSLSNLK